VQVMDRVRVFEAGQGLNAVQAELFPDISIGDAPATAEATGSAPAAAPPAAAPPAAAPRAAATPIHATASASGVHP
jgi:hypothetical protein